MPKARKPPSQTWRIFLNNHIREMVSIDFLTVPTVTFRVLYVLVVLAHDRRRVVHFNVTEHPTAAWTAQQIIEAFPEETAPRFLLRDRDQIYGEEFRRRVAGMRIEEVMTAPHSPWQSPYVERLIGSIRRECLDHVIVLGENHLRRIMRSYIAYYYSSSQYSFVLCPLKYELFLRRIRYRPTPVVGLRSRHQLFGRCRLEVTTTKNPRPIG